jgi:hypothetical protein
MMATARPVNVTMHVVPPSVVKVVSAVGGVDVALLDRDGARQHPGAIVKHVTAPGPVDVAGMLVPLAIIPIVSAPIVVDMSRLDDDDRPLRRGVGVDVFLNDDGFVGWRRRRAPVAIVGVHDAAGRDETRKQTERQEYPHGFSFPCLRSLRFDLSVTRVS